VYRSVTFNPDWTDRKDKDCTLFDNHHLGNRLKGEAIILKMTQRFAIDPELKADQQIRKTEFNL
jgi:hypothetical protein